MGDHGAHRRRRQFDKPNESRVIRTFRAASGPGILCAKEHTKIMAGKVRPLDHRPIRLSEPVRLTIERLARLANVTPSEIVDFILTEVLQEAGLPDPLPEAPPASLATRGSRSTGEPATVIPITSARRARTH